jgi:hypothetical protein
MLSSNFYRCYAALRLTRSNIPYSPSALSNNLIKLFFLEATPKTPILLLRPKPPRNQFFKAFVPLFEHEAKRGVSLF